VRWRDTYVADESRTSSYLSYLSPLVVLFHTYHLALFLAIPTHIISYTMSSYDDYLGEFDPYFNHDFSRMDSPESEWSQLETPIGDEVDEDIDVASEGSCGTPVVDMIVKSRGGSP
jgi:hypothetical protein